MIQLNSVRLIHGPSLFNPLPCVLITLSTGESGRTGDAVLTRAAAEWPEIAAQIKAGHEEPQRALPFAAHLIATLIRHCLAHVSLPTDGISSREDRQQQKIFVAVPQQNALLTAEIVARCCRYTVALYRGEETSALAKDVRSLLAGADALQKKAAIADIQRHLAGGNVPWLALDGQQHNKDLLQLGFGRQQRLINRTTGAATSHIGVNVSLSKRRTLAFLAQAGFPVPQQLPVENLQHALQQARHLGYPLVLKAEHGSKGERVFADLRSDDELSRSYEHLMALIRHIRQATGVLIEQHVQGRVFRVEVINGIFFDAYDMMPAAVTGDGKHTIRQLIERENAQPNRQDNGHLKAKYCPLRLGAAEQLMLKKQGLSADALPQAGQLVRLSANSNWSAGGTFKRVSDQVHPDNIRLVEQVAAAFRIDMLGIDLITEDISASFVDEPLTFIEVNHSPYIASYTDDETGETLDNGPRLVARLAPGLAYGQMPVIVVTGSALSTPIADAVTQGLIDSGHCPGRILPDHIAVNGVPAGIANSTTSADPALTLLRRPDTGAAVVEKTLVDMADSGIGSGGCDIAIITDDQAQTLTSRVWSQGLASEEVIQLLAKQARCGIVICAQRLETIDLCRSVPRERCIFTTSEPTLAEAAHQAGLNVLVEDDAAPDASDEARIAHLAARGVAELLAKPAPDCGR